MFIIIALMCIFLTLAFHEIGHAIAMHKCGVKITEIGLGMPVGLPHLSFRLNRWKDIQFTIHPLLLGAYVKPADGETERMKTLSFWDNVFMLCNGVQGNMLFGLLIAAGVLITKPVITETIWYEFGIVTILALLLITFSRACSKLTLTLIPACVMLLVKLAKSSSLDLMGPVGIVQETVNNTPDLHSALNMGFSLSVSLVVLNLLPICPLDGGKIISFLLEKKFPRIERVYRGLGVATIAIFILEVTGHDIFRLFK